jgi:biopolymer transport protein ExbD
MQKGRYAMKSLIEVCVLGAILMNAAGAQETTPPALRKGVSVQMATADHAVPMQAADAPQATVIALTAKGKLYAGVERVESDALTKLSAATVYVKADARVPYQKVLTVLDALRGKRVVLLTTPLKSVEGARILPPFGIEVSPR